MASGVPRLRAQGWASSSGRVPPFASPCGPGPLPTYSPSFLLGSVGKQRKKRLRFSSVNVNWDILSTRRFQLTGGSSSSSSPSGVPGEGGALSAEVLGLAATVAAAAVGEDAGEAKSGGRTAVRTPGEGDVCVSLCTERHTNISLMAFALPSVLCRA